MKCRTAFIKNWNYIDLHDISLSKQELSAVCEENEIKLTQSDLELIYNATFGWIPAVEAYLNYYQHHQEIMETEHLYAVVKNIYQHISKRLKKAVAGIIPVQFVHQRAVPGYGGIRFYNKGAG